MCIRDRRGSIIGRVGMSMPDGPQIFPVNFSVVEDSVIFRTTPYSVLGTHAGIHRFTVGQRRGVGGGAGVPRYVTSIDAASGDVTVGTRADLAVAGFVARDVRWTGRPHRGAAQPSGRAEAREPGHLLRRRTLVRRLRRGAERWHCRACGTHRGS